MHLIMRDRRTNAATRRITACGCWCKAARGVLVRVHAQSCSLSKKTTGLRDHVVERDAGCVFCVYLSVSKFSLSALTVALFRLKTQNVSA